MVYAWTYDLLSLSICKIFFSLFLYETPIFLIIFLINLTIILSVSFIILLYTAIFKKSRQARILLFSIATLFIGTMLCIGYYNGFLPITFITVHGILIGGAIQMVILSLGLADKINIMKSELQDMNINLEEKVERRTEELNAAMEELVAINDSLIEKSSELQTARDAIWGEMQLAKKIQTVLLPQKPQIPGYEIIGHMTPADDVGGDYYDVININGTNWIAIGDVSGHGVPAGLVMMMVQTSIQTVVDQFPDIPPSKLLSSINRVVTRNIRRLGEDKYMTITVFAAHEDGEFTYSGHHQDLMVYRREKDSVELIETTGMWIGILDDLKDFNKNQTFQMNSGDVLLLYTDGITEATDSDGEMFSEDRLASTFGKMCRNGSAADIRNGILKEIEPYKRDDDVTMVVVKRL